MLKSDGKPITAATMTSSKDQIYAKNLAHWEAFKFDDAVADVFDDMINRSVPGYRTITKMSGLIASVYSLPNTNLYDLGCSLGASTLEMRSQVLPENCKIVAIDNSKAMLKKCRQAVAEDENDVPVEFQCINLEKANIANASIVLLNWTLQFIPTENREQVIQNIYNGLLPGGVLLLSEKILLEDSELNQINIDLHESFKKANGYSDLEIARKRAALDTVLIPESLSQHKERLLLCGFKTFDIWFRYFNFASLIAIK